MDKWVPLAADKLHDKRSAAAVRKRVRTVGRLPEGGSDLRFRLVALEAELQRVRKTPSSQSANGSPFQTLSPSDGVAGDCAPSVSTTGSGLASCSGFRSKACM